MCMKGLKFSLLVFIVVLFTSIRCSDNSKSTTLSDLSYGDTLIFNLFDSTGNGFNQEKMILMKDIVTYDNEKYLKKGQFLAIKAPQYSAEIQFVVGSKTLDSLKSYMNYNEIIQLERELLKLPKDLLNQLTQVLFIAEQRYHEMKQRPFQKELKDISFSRTAISFLKSCENHDKEMLNAANAFCQNNPEIKNYDREIILKLFKFCSCEDELKDWGSE